jgi:hypothetical protein
MNHIVPIKLLAANEAARELLAYAEERPVYTLLWEKEDATYFFGVSYSSPQEMGTWLKLFELPEAGRSYEPKQSEFTKGPVTFKLERLDAVERIKFEKGLEGKFLE